MPHVTAQDFLGLVEARPGHFLLESGHHGALWLDLDPLFADPRAVEPFVLELSAALRSYDVSVVCGPMLGGAFLAQLIAQNLGIRFCFTERVEPATRDGLYRIRYRLPSAFVRRMRGKRIAIVDDVMSAGSALRATYEELLRHGGQPVVAGALLTLGSAGSDFFTAKSIRVEAVARHSYDLWLPADCPLCAQGVKLEAVAAAAPAA